MSDFQDKSPNDIRDCKYKSLDDLVDVSISVVSELNRHFCPSESDLVPNADLPSNIPG